jgi:hypothetical protein
MKTILNTWSKALFTAGLLIAIGTGCSKETGCKDPLAANYDPNAEKDCCCFYEIITESDNTVISGSITSNTTWTSDNIYELAGKVVVENNATLTIQPGTIIKGRTGTGSLASALIISRGAKLMAEGNSSQPIIFTSIIDNIAIGQLVGSNLSELDNGRWGGLIILGNARISAEEGDDMAQIEGIPANEAYGAYGGDDDNDNSGIIRYVSVRHGGALIGEGNEINGITLGGVGSGTVIDHVEVVANEDDGIEFFGGSVNVTNVIIAFQKDDGIGIDQNYSGTVDNFFVIHGVSTDEGLEIDGPEGSLSDGYFTLRNGTIRNTTPGTGSAADLKSKAQGTIENVTFWGYDGGSWMKVRASFQEDCSTPKSDAYSYFIQTPAKLTIIGCEFGNPIGDDIFKVYTASTDANTVTCPVPANYQTDADFLFNPLNPLQNASTASVGADLSQFDNWSWAYLKNKY